MWRAYIDGGSDYFRRSVRLHLLDVHADGSATVLVPLDGAISEVRVVEGEAAPEGSGFTLPADSLHALLAELARHLGAVEHPAQLRRDYEAERARVDKLIEAVIPPRLAARP